MIFYSLIWFTSLMCQFIRINNICVNYEWQTYLTKVRAQSQLCTAIVNVMFIWFYEGPNPTKCQKAYLEALRNYLPGRFIPRCTRDGKFEPIQQDGEDAYCVDGEGKEISGTRLTRPFRPKCVVGRFPCLLVHQYKKTPVFVDVVFISLSPKCHFLNENVK